MGLTTFCLGVLVSGFLVFLLVSLDPESLGLSTIPCFICFLTEESCFEVTWVSSDASVVRLIEPEASSLCVRVFLLDPDRGLFKVVEMIFFETGSFILVGETGVEDVDWFVGLVTLVSGPVGNVTGVVVAVVVVVKAGMVCLDISGAIVG